MARRIRDCRFTPVRLRSGYQMGDVDAMLDDAERAAVAGEPLEPVLRRELPQAAARETYAIAEVDALVDSLLTGPLGRAYEAARLGRSESDLPESARSLLALLADVRFKERMFRGGHVVGDVDRMLDEAFVAVLERRSLGPVLATTIGRVKRGRGYDDAEVDAFLTRLRAEG